LTTSVVITGPLAPADVDGFLTGRDREVAQSIQGYRGVPTSELVKALLAAGLHVEVVTEAVGIDGYIQLEGPNLRLLVAPLRERARARAGDLFRAERRALRALLDDTEGSVVHALWTYEFAWAALDTGRPVLVTAHDAPLTILRQVRDPYRAVRTAMAYVVRTKIRHLTAVSPYLARRWRIEMLYRRPIAIVPNIAPSFAQRDGRWSEGVEMALIDVTDSGPLKNVRALIEALGLLRADGRETTLNLVGPGLGAEDELARQARARGLAGGIRFLGTLDREGTMDALARSSVFVHPSREESFGLSVAEAMSAGLPVVAGRHSGAIPWVLADGDAGVLVDIDQPSEIAAAIVRLLDDKECARGIAERGRQRVRSQFSPEVVAAAYIDAYDGLPRRAGGAR
jgi:glycosyltransferase involved in cell wall biosynthesis